MGQSSSSINSSNSNASCPFNASFFCCFCCWLLVRRRRRQMSNLAKCSSSLSLPCFWPFESAQHTLLFNAIALRSSLALPVKLATHIARAGPNVQFAKNTEWEKCSAIKLNCFRTVVLVVVVVVVVVQAFHRLLSRHCPGLLFVHFLFLFFSLSFSLLARLLLRRPHWHQNLLLFLVLERCSSLCVPVSHQQRRKASLSLFYSVNTFTSFFFFLLNIPSMCVEHTHTHFRVVLVNRAEESFTFFCSFVTCLFFSVVLDCYWIWIDAEVMWWPKAFRTYSFSSLSVVVQLQFTIDLQTIFFILAVLPSSIEQFTSSFFPFSFLSLLSVCLCFFCFC